MGISSLGQSAYMEDLRYNNNSRKDTSMEKLESKTVVQIGIIVRNAAKTAENYADIFDIPMPEVVTIADESISNTRYLGKPTDAIGKAAFFDMGTVQIELIEPIGGPSTWQEFLDEHGQGIHHVALKVQDINQTNELLDQKQIPLIQSGAWDGGEYTYFDATEKLGLILEILKINE
jgi:methylmalonyl-CoA/ethylmalonyl-CoA epimerase